MGKRGRSRSVKKAGTHSYGEGGGRRRVSAGSGRERGGGGGGKGNTGSEKGGKGPRKLEEVWMVQSPEGFSQRFPKRARLTKASSKYGGGTDFA